jgi:hypothetical protein
MRQSARHGDERAEYRTGPLQFGDSVSVNAPLTPFPCSMFVPSVAMWPPPSA